MAIFEATALTTLVTASAGSPLGALRAGTKPMRVYEIGHSAITAPTTSGRLSLGHSTAIGTGALTQVFGASVDPANYSTAALGSIVTAWATAVPTLTSTTRKRAFAFPPNIGAAVIWSWPNDREMVIPPNAAANSELVLINDIAFAPGTWLIYAVWEE
jgi:hypothetical protein